MLATASDSVDSRGSVWIANHSDRVLTTAKLRDNPNTRRDTSAHAFDGEILNRSQQLRLR